MSYTPNNWKPGDVLTAAKMNKLEAAVAQGGGGAFKVNVDVSSGTPTLDASYNDIIAAVEAGKVVFTNQEIEGIQLILYLSIYSSNNLFSVSFYNQMMGGMEFTAETADALLEFAQQGA